MSWCFYVRKGQSGSINSAEFPRSLCLLSRHGLPHLWKEDTGSLGLLGLLWHSGSEVPEMLSAGTDKSKVWILQPCVPRRSELAPEK